MVTCLCFPGNHILTGMFQIFNFITIYFTFANCFAGTLFIYSCIYLFIHLFID